MEPFDLEERAPCILQVLTMNGGRIDISLNAVRKDGRNQPWIPVNGYSLNGEPYPAQRRSWLRLLHVDDLDNFNDLTIEQIVAEATTIVDRGIIGVLAPERGKAIRFRVCHAQTLDP